MLKLFRDLTLIIAMLFGIAAHGYLAHLSFMLPFLVFAMLFLSFAKLSFNEFKAKPLHIRLLLIQAASAFGAYALFVSFDKVVAESVLVCLIAPTAGSASVITQRLGGNAASTAVYIMISNFFAALVIPLLFPLIEPHPELPSIMVSAVILQKLFLLLILPFLTVQALSRFVPALHGRIANYSWFSFYVGAASLAVVSAVTYSEIVSAKTTFLRELFMAFTALAVCALQFIAGKTAGSRYHDRISGGQAIGQKNTVFAVWLSMTYMNPVSVVGPGSYILWQTIINSYQLWRRERRDN